ncbi:MAG: hypothetical protein AAGC57_15185 [Pseudomonadota bacterium]
MDPTTTAGVAVLIAKLSAFALLVYASHRASKAVREAKAARETEANRAAETAATDATPLRRAA